MDILHTQLAVIQHRLAFVQTDPIDWRYYVVVFSWGICLFESYLLYAHIHLSPISHRLLRSRSQNLPFWRTACGSTHFIRSQLRLQSLPITLHLRCSRILRNMANTRPSFQSSPGYISSSSIPFNFPRTSTIPGLGGLLVNFWDWWGIIQNIWYVLESLLGPLFDPSPFLDNSIGCLCFSLDIHYQSFDLASWPISDFCPRGAAWL
jgi:hypothetical protein